jgi:hypothetical protein
MWECGFEAKNRGGREPPGLRKKTNNFSLVQFKFYVERFGIIFKRKEAKQCY